MDETDWVSGLKRVTRTFAIKLQYAQNCVARLIYNKRKYDHVTELQLELHWLPIKYRILCIYLLTYKYINSTLFPHSEELKFLVSVDS